MKKYVSIMIMIASVNLVGCRTTMQQPSAAQKITYEEKYKSSVNNIVKDGYAETEHGWYSKNVVTHIDMGNVMDKGGIYINKVEPVILKPGGYVIAKPKELKRTENND